MAPLTDPTRLKAYKEALGNWRFDGYVRFKLTEEAHRWLRTELVLPLPDLTRLMLEFVASGGEIDEVRETGVEWSDKYEFHYDLRFAIHQKPVYLETRLHCPVPFAPDVSWILVVNIHAP